MAKNTANFLELKNAHPRDARITFDEEHHLYTVDGEPYTKSVSGVVHDSFPSFDAPEIIERYFTSWSENKQSPYHNFIKYCRYRMHLDDATIKNELANVWRVFGEERADYGTSVHLSAELFLNNAERKDESQEYSQFMYWYKEMRPKTWEQYRTEWSVFCDDCGVAGQIDSLWRDVQTGEFIMVDWKCVETLPRFDKFGKKGLPPFEGLPNTNFGHYTVQQNAYAWILRRHYGIDVKRMLLLQVHHTLTLPEVHELRDIRSSVETCMLRRRDILASADLVLDHGKPSKKGRADVTGLILANERRRSYYLAMAAAVDKENAALRRSIA